jgi:DNA-binding beta-propeller fold protein YncE
MVVGVGFSLCHGLLWVNMGARHGNGCPKLVRNTHMQGQVDTLVGNGTAGFSGDGGAGNVAQIAEPFGVIIGPDAGLYFCDLGNHRIRCLDLASATVRTVAGTGEAGNSGDGGPALSAQLNQPYEIRFDAAGNLVFVDMLSHVVRRIDRASQTIETIAGTGQAGFAGDGGPASAAQLDRPPRIEFDRSGDLYICDIANHRIRRVFASNGLIETFAGTGEQLETLDGMTLAQAPLNGPRALAFADNADMYVVLREGNVVLHLDARTQQFRRIAGTGERGYSGDGGDARAADLSGPKGIALKSEDALYIADTESHTVRRIDLSSGVISTVLGDGSCHDGPDGDPRTCGLARPHGIFVTSDGTIYVGDSENHRVRVLR